MTRRPQAWHSSVVPILPFVSIWKPCGVAGRCQGSPSLSVRMGLYYEEKGEIANREQDKNIRHFCRGTDFPPVGIPPVHIDLDMPTNKVGMPRTKQTALKGIWLFQERPPLVASLPLSSCRIVPYVFAAFSSASAGGRGRAAVV